MNNRAGYYVKQLQGDLAYKAFLPNPLPPKPGIQLNSLVKTLSMADQRIGRLDGLLKNIPNPELFVLMYMKKEAVLSSQIEGTQASLSDILEKEEDILSGITENNDVTTTLNYVKAMDYGLERIRKDKFPLSLRLIKELHKILLTGVRGKDKRPGEFRKSQNWIGPEGCPLAAALFVPPPVYEMNDAMGQLEKYLYDENNPVLIKCGLIHAQFETIHPFLDGNGRIGRLLITLLLILNNVISEPGLYLSYYFQKRKIEYYEKLTAIRLSGDWENWLKFFLTGIAETSDNAIELSNNIIKLRKEYSELVREKMIRSSTAIQFLDKIFIHPVFTVNEIKNYCNVSYNTAKNMIIKFKTLGIITEGSNKHRNRKYFFTKYISLLNEGTQL